MSRKARNRMTRETIPEGFSAPMAFVDLLPVVFFGLSAVKAGNLFHSGLFVAGAVVCLLSGVVKVGWKLIAAVSQRNIWPMFVQLSGFPACLFFLAGALGMILMLVFAFWMDSSDPKVNWMEQTVNSLAQICFFIGLMLA